VTQLVRWSSFWLFAAGASFWSAWSERGIGGIVLCLLFLFFASEAYRAERKDEVKAILDSMAKTRKARTS
jgi:hypothetical protein